MPDFQPAVDSSLILTIIIQTTTKHKKSSNTYSASAVAISKRRALTSLHGKIPLNTRVKITTRNGVHLAGKVEFERFEKNMVDIAVILLDSTLAYTHYIDCTNQRVKLTQDITVVGLKYSIVGDTVNTYARRTTVDMIEEFGPTSALFQAQYYSFDGCSGTGVVTVTENNVVKVVGVHVASHEDMSSSSRSSQIQGKRKYSIDSYADFEASVHSAIHGHKAYSLVCEIARVPDLVQLLSNPSNEV